MSKPTTGPWKVISEATAREIEVFEIAEVSHFRVVCDCEGSGFDRNGDAHADARLIASAPDLLAALQKIAAIENQLYGPDWEEIEQAREISSAAIAKATGETP